MLNKWLAKIGTALVAVFTLFGLMKMKEASDKKAGKKEQQYDDLVANKEAQKEARKDVKEIADSDDNDLANRL